ncbi:MAG: DUF2027 domain-containing protein [Bacteroidales bacterium]|nr:DUF2027 domain-containing protein [Bacteroidales bacterium]
MSSFKVGQKVAFISMRQSGVVSRIEGDIVFVEIEKGFEIPTTCNDLILLEDIASDMKQKEKEKDAEKDSEYRKKSQHIHLNKGLYFSIIPSSDSPQTFECYLVNFTSFVIAFHLIEKSKAAGHQTIHYDFLQPGDAIVVLDKSYKDLLHIDTLLIQCMIVDVKEHQFFETLVHSFSINWHMLLTPEIFQPNPFFDEKAYVIKVLSFEEKIHRIGELPAQKNILTSKETANNQSSEVKSYLIDRFMIDDETAEVDLHAEKIFLSSEHTHPSDILRKQISFAKQCLDSAREKGIKRIIFIHGAGKGTLKFELYSLLRTENNIQYGEASLLKYGGGAIEVVILSS